MIDSNLPSGWAVATLEALTVPKVPQAEPGPTKVPYIDISAIDRDAKRIGATEKVSRETAPTRARQWLRSGDVLVSMTRPNLNAVAMVPPALDGAVASTGFDVLRMIGVLPEWVFNRVRTNEFVADVCEGLQGVVYPAIRPRDVRRHQLPIPPLAEQRRIVATLDAHMTRLDDAVNGLERVQRNLKRYRASVLRAAVEGRLVPTEAELARAEGRDYEPASVLLERVLGERRRRWEKSELERLRSAGKEPKDEKWKRNYEEPSALDTSGQSQLPDGWCWTTLGQLKEFSLYGPRFSSDAYTPDGYLVLRTSDISESGKVNMESPPRIALSVDEFERWKLAIGDLLVTRTGSIGTLAVLADSVEAIAGAYLIQFRLAAPLETAWFSFYVLKSPAGKQRLLGGSAGVGRPNINAPMIEGIAFGLPPLAEQARIASELDRLLSLADGLERLTETALRRIGILRQAVLNWAFEGRLVDQDPTDEPAPVLLERIGKSRAAATDEPRPARGRGRRRARA